MSRYNPNLAHSNASGRAIGCQDHITKYIIVSTWENRAHMVEITPHYVLPHILIHINHGHMKLQETDMHFRMCGESSSIFFLTSVLFQLDYYTVQNFF